MGNQKCGQATWNAHTHDSTNDRYYQDPDKAGVACAAATCNLGGVSYTTAPTGDGLTCMSALMKCGDWTDVATDIAASTEAGKYIYSSAEAGKYCKSKQCNVLEDRDICLYQTCSHLTTANCDGQTGYHGLNPHASGRSCTAATCAAGTDKAICCNSDCSTFPSSSCPSGSLEGTPANFGCTGGLCVATSTADQAACCTS